MANTPKAVRRTAKLHSLANRKGDVWGKSGAKTTASINKWPKMSWDEGVKAAEYVGGYTKRNSEFIKGQAK